MPRQRPGRIIRKIPGASGDSGSNPDTTAEVAKDASQIKVGLVLSTGGLGDKNFNDMAYAGLQRPRRILTS